MRLTKIQKLLNGERRGRKFGVVLDFVVGVFQQRPKQPHVDSLDLDANVKMTDTQGKREGFIPVRVDSKSDGSPPPVAEDTISLARCTKTDFFGLLFQSVRFGYITDIQQRTDQSFLRLSALLRRHVSRRCKTKTGKQPKSKSTLISVLYFKINLNRWLGYVDVKREVSVVQYC